LRLQGPDSLLEFSVLLFKASLFRFNVYKVISNALNNAILVYNNIALLYYSFFKAFNKLIKFVTINASSFIFR
jgi:hypothetical protein